MLVRDPAQENTDLVAKCRELGFTAPWNSPRKTVQDGCTYTEVSADENVAEDVAEEGRSAALLSALKIRGGAGGLGFGGPLHASCKVIVPPLVRALWVQEGQICTCYMRAPPLLISLVFLACPTSFVGYYVQMTIAFPKNSCSEVAEAIVSSAKGMMGFDNCNGGNK